MGAGSQLGALPWLALILGQQRFIILIIYSETKGLQYGLSWLFLFRAWALIKLGNVLLYSLKNTN